MSSYSQTGTPTVFDSIVAFARAVASPLVGWWERATLQDELTQLDDRMLADIGISRADIPAVAAGRYLGRTLDTPRMVAEQANRVWRPEIPAAHNDQAARVA
jgi:uncharacterized protein YjiS (DUF1127 family)